MPNTVHSSDHNHTSTTTQTRVPLLPLLYHSTHVALTRILTTSALRPPPPTSPLLVLVDSWCNNVLNLPNDLTESTNKGIACSKRRPPPRGLNIESHMISVHLKALDRGCPQHLKPTKPLVSRPPAKASFDATETTRMPPTPPASILSMVHGLRDIQRETRSLPLTATTTTLRASP